MRTRLIALGAAGVGCAAWILASCAAAVSPGRAASASVAERPAATSTAAGSAVASSRPGSTRAPILRVPPHAIRVPIENVDGALLLSARLSSATRGDTTGRLVLDTGAGYIALDPSLIRWLELADREVDVMTFAERPLRRIAINEFTQDVVGPVLAVETDIIEQVTDRGVLGLLGYSPLASFALHLDPRIDTVAMVPMRRDGLAATAPRRATATDLAASMAAGGMAVNASREQLAEAIDAKAVAIPFELEGDGKILVRAKVGGSARPLLLVLDTGATKSVIFRSAFESARGASHWPELHGLSAPTLYGSETTYMARVPRIALDGASGSASVADVDVAVMDSELEAALSRAVKQPVEGLLGYSFLRRFRTTIDYPHRVLWLEPIAVPRDLRPYEYSHVGIQIERRAGALRVVSVATGSPAAKAGIRIGDEIAGIGGVDAAKLDVVAASRRMEGRPGTALEVAIRRDARIRSYRLTRREML